MLIFVRAGASGVTSGGSSSSSSSSSTSSSGLGSSTSRPGSVLRRDTSARSSPHDDKFVVHRRSKAQRRIIIAATSLSPFRFSRRTLNRCSRDTWSRTDPPRYRSFITRSSILPSPLRPCDLSRLEIRIEMNRSSHRRGCRFGDDVGRHAT